MKKHWVLLRIIISMQRIGKNTPISKVRNKKEASLQKIHYSKLRQTGKARITSSTPAASALVVLDCFVS